MRPDANVGTCRLARARLGQPAARFAHMPTLTHDDDVLIPIKGGQDLATTPDAAQISWPPLFRFGGRRRAAFVTASVQVRLTVDSLGQGAKSTICCGWVGFGGEPRVVGAALLAGLADR